MPDEDGHPRPDEMDLRTVLHALADPLRFAVIAQFLREPEEAERTCAYFQLPVSKSTTSHHFKVMREAGLLRMVDNGNSRSVVLRRRELDARFPGLLALVGAEPAHD
ncbi:ArsR/SmtB family transcription factor [Streptomyces flavofungini]|uniref:Helix-turn-helix transcriptional regulator n=1 Tax=Streptomyces flavofungini TaxID=68200 RepID=A0ABS0X943_9ACTN|nr:helix-turn-helix domain-containing protein [Streptomyces flavofungini]MBJ3809494.1 helix-turn-helix transcriptional regulator [Streptomyces flavofungini]GHC55080.1 transcriptional regulator [Streptomyces flavofungini]